MIILNFSHPLTAEQRGEIESLVGERIDEVRDVATQLDNEKVFEPQVTTLIDSAGLSVEEWQTARLLINPPAYTPATAVLLAELHGLMGYFPAVIRLRPVPDALPPRFETAEIINLQQVRANARARRSEKEINEAPAS